MRLRRRRLGWKRKKNPNFGKSPPGDTCISTDAVRAKKGAAGLLDIRCGGKGG